MSSDSSQRPNEREAARQARLRQALRDNLKKRKAQLRGRADLAAVEAGLLLNSGPEPDDPDRS